MRKIQNNLKLFPSELTICVLICWVSAASAIIIYAYDERRGWESTSHPEIPEEKQIGNVKKL
jgi:cell division protein FtsL